MSKQFREAFQQHVEVAGILAASARARDLVQQILTFSRRHEPERHAIVLQPVVYEALRLVRATVPASIEIRSEIAAECHFVLANASQIHQVLVNLCANAAHAMRERPGRLSVSCGNVDLAEPFCHQHSGLRCGPHVHLQVMDTGSGMDPATLERSFEPFFTTKPPSEGTGLGLAVVHGIVVFKGDLSLVGPRPHAVRAKADERQYNEVVEGYFARHRVRPGMTGWAQVNGWRGETDTSEKLQHRVEHDLYYIENWSLLFDIYIIAITPFALIKAENAY